MRTVASLFGLVAMLWRLGTDWMTGLLAAACCAALGGCAPEEARLSDGFLRLYAQPHPTPADFFVCHGYGCAQTSRIGLSREEWQSVLAAFAPPAADAGEERRNVARAVALFEALVGARIGTSAHQRLSEHQTAVNVDADPTQLDCIDDAVNTWTYLTMFDGARLLRYHRVGPLAYAGTVFTLDMRNTAVLVAKADGERFAVDASLVDARVPPPIVPLALWAREWPNIPAPAAQSHE